MGEDRVGQDAVAAIARQGVCPAGGVECNMGSWAMPKSRNGIRKAIRTPAIRPNSGARMTPIMA